MIAKETRIGIWLAAMPILGGLLMIVNRHPVFDALISDTVLEVLLTPILQLLWLPWAALYMTTPIWKLSEFGLVSCRGVVCTPSNILILATSLVVSGIVLLLFKYRHQIKKWAGTICSDPRS